MNKSICLLIFCVLLVPSAGYSSECVVQHQPVPTQLEASIASKVLKRAKLFKKVKKLLLRGQKNIAKAVGWVLILSTIIVMFALAAIFGIESILLVLVFGGGVLLLIGVVLVVLT